VAAARDAPLQRLPVSMQRAVTSHSSCTALSTRTVGALLCLRKLNRERVEGSIVVILLPKHSVCTTCSSTLFALLLVTLKQASCGTTLAAASKVYQ
jgi:hypothetical protein